MPYQVNVVVSDLNINANGHWVGEAAFTYNDASNNFLAAGAIEPFASPAAFPFNSGTHTPYSHVQYTCVNSSSFPANIIGPSIITPVTGTLSLVGATYGNQATGKSNKIAPTYAEATVGTISNSVAVSCPINSVTCTQLHFKFVWVVGTTTNTVYFRSADPRSTNNGSGEPPHDSIKPSNDE